MTVDVEILVLTGTWFGCMIASAVWWQRHWFYRYLPIFFGAPIGALVALKFGRTEPLLLMRDLLTGAGIGVIFWFCVWLEVRFGR